MDRTSADVPPARSRRFVCAERPTVVVPCYLGVGDAIMPSGFGSDRLLAANGTKMPTVAVDGVEMQGDGVPAGRWGPR